MKKELKNILVPVDFMGPSLNAVHYATYLSQKFNGELILLNVIETPGLLAEFFLSGDQILKIIDKAKNKLEDLAKEIQVKNPDIKVNTRIERGKPYKKILEVAKDTQARIIILGENHLYSDHKEVLGTTVYHVTLKSPVPVLTYKGKTEKMVEKVVVPLDLTKETRKQLFSALAYGLNYGAKIYLVSVLIGGIRIKNSRIYKKISKAKKTVEENGVDCFAKILDRSNVPPYKRIIEYAEEVDAGMILIMTHQEGSTNDNYIGAFAHHIINESSVPVLSLTYTATEDDFSDIFQGFIDPLGIFSAK